MLLSDVFQLLSALERGGHFFNEKSLQRCFRLRTQQEDTAVKLCN